jgi:hypothetical protein
MPEARVAIQSSNQMVGDRSLVRRHKRGGRASDASSVGLINQITALRGDDPDLRFILNILEAHVFRISAARKPQNSKQESGGPYRTRTYNQLIKSRPVGGRASITYGHLFLGDRLVTANSGAVFNRNSWEAIGAIARRPFTQNRVFMRHSARNSVLDHIQPKLNDQ